MTIFIWNEFDGLAYASIWSRSGWPSELVIGKSPVIFLVRSTRIFPSLPESSSLEFVIESSQRFNSFFRSARKFTKLREDTKWSKLGD